MKKLYIVVRDKSAEIREKDTDYLLAIVYPHKLGLSASARAFTEVLEKIKEAVSA